MKGLLHHMHTDTCSRLELHADTLFSLCFWQKTDFGGREEEEGRESEGESGLREKNGEESRVQEEGVRDGTGGVKEGIKEESEKEEWYF